MADFQMNSTGEEMSVSVMIVDDHPDNLYLLSQFLGRHYKVRPFRGGAQALKSAFHSPPDVILLDIMMPEMDGYEVAAKLQANDDTREIPVIFISALDDVNSKIQAFSSGGVDFITKPFKEFEVLARVRTHLALRNLRRDLQTANARLAAQLAELQERNQELDAFAHTVAHDLKTPLSAVIMTSNLMVDSLNTMSHQEIRNDLNTILEVGEKMNRVLEGLMLLAGLRKMVFEMTPVDMKYIVANALQSMDLFSRRAGAMIICPDQWPEVFGYPSWVEEAWVNYISNAIKYGGRPEEGIAPRVELGFDTPEGLPSDQVRFWVRDNGCGLTYEQQKQLFTPFERLRNMRVEGHGLGLSIVQRVVEEMGGQVGVESVVGQGSLFYFTLQRAPAL